MAAPTRGVPLAVNTGGVTAGRGISAAGAGAVATGDGATGVLAAR